MTQLYTHEDRLQLYNIVLPVLMDWHLGGGPATTASHPIRFSSVTNLLSLPSLSLQRQSLLFKTLYLKYFS